MGRILIIILLLSIGSVVVSQGFKLPYYTIGGGGIFSAGRQVPFWLVSNQHGKYSVEPAAGFMDALIETKADSGKKFDYNLGLELFDRYDGVNTFWIHQAYVSARYRFICLRAGNKEEIYGNQDSLSVGSVLWSGNARPIPEVVISTNGYVDIPLTKGYLQVSGMLSHGWFGNDGYIKDAYLHHKNLYVKLGGKFPVNISYGLEHYAQWGGVDPVNGPLPSGWDAYKRIFTANEGNSVDPTTPAIDSLNRLGNHLGSRQYAVDIKFNKFPVSLYYQTIFEDNSGKRKYFMRDGLWGISFNNRMRSKIVSKVLYEYFHSEYQSGGIIHGEDGSTFVDDYFNNYVYKSGWTHQGYTIGIPLITSPILSGSPGMGIVNNRIIAHNFAIEGLIEKKINYKLHFTLNKNMGSYANPFPEILKSTSVLLQISNVYQHTKGFEAIVQLAFDMGEMYGNNFGLGITIRKHGMF